MSDPSIMRALVLALSASLVLCPAHRAVAADSVIVFAAGAVKAAMVDLSAKAEREDEVRATVAYDTVGVLRDRALGGEAVDVVVLSRAAIDQLAKAGQVRGIRVTIGQTGIGLAARPGLGVGPIDTPERLVAVLRGAGSIAFADPARGATAGTQFARAVDLLGLAGPLADRLSVRPFGVDVIAAVARGEVDLGVSQATEILAHPDVAFVGLLPDPHNVWTVYEAAATRETPATARFLARLAAPAGEAAFRRIGFVATTQP